VKCRACGASGARPRDCCLDRPVFCDRCKELHDRRVHPEEDDWQEDDWEDDDLEDDWEDDEETY
jgi:hypothetical protein